VRAMGVAAKLRELRWRAAGHYSRPLPEAFVAPLRGATALEIGGPSHFFSGAGLLPVYDACAAVDGVQFAAETIWHGEQAAGAFTPQPGPPTGTMHVTDGATLAGIPDDHYDAIFSSHVIEHLANPLGALAAWRRVAHAGAHLLLVAPHMAGTFDHRRAVTPLQHMVEDFERGTGEDDLTHLDETLALHDRSRDAEGDDQEAWAAARRDNLHTRVLHHHVFTTESLLALLDRAGIQLHAVEVRYPHDIYIIGQFAAAPDNAESLDAGAAWRATSPFAVDRATSSAASAAAAASASPATHA
jgi:SAM-dependent methyltransferase